MRDFEFYANLDEVAKSLGIPKEDLMNIRKPKKWEDMTKEERDQAIQASVDFINDDSMFADWKILSCGVCNLHDYPNCPHCVESPYF